MAQPIAQPETESWNPALRSENGDSTTKTPPTEGVASVDDSQDKSLADVISPQSDDFSAWDISDEPGENPTPYSTMDGLVSTTAPVTGSNPSLDTDHVEDKSIEPPEEMDGLSSANHSAIQLTPIALAPKTSETPEEPEPVQIEPDTTQVQQKEAEPSYATQAEIPSVQWDETDTDPDDPWASFEQQLNSTLPSTVPAPEGQLHETAPKLEPTPNPVQKPDSPTVTKELSPDALEGPVVTTPALIHKLNDVIPSAEKTAPSAEDIPAMPFDTQESGLTTHNHPEAWKTETKTRDEDGLPWANGGDGAASEENDFFDQLNTQTKPIFAHHEAEPFKEGLPLSDESTPASPERPMEMRPSIGNVLANEEDTTDNFFASGPQAEVPRTNPTQELGPGGFDLYSPATDASAAAQLDDILEGATSQSQTANWPQETVETSEEDLAARWEAELGDSADEKADDDLAARWAAALDEDDMLLDTETTLPQASEKPVHQAPAQATSGLSSGLGSPFQPQSYPQPGTGLSQYTPHQPSTSDLLGGVPVPANAPPPPETAAIPSYFSQKPANPVATRGESFAEQSKQGYKSPYDLPDDISRPRKPLVTAKPTQPTITSMPPPPPPASGARPPSATGLSSQSAPPAPKNFYEELPMPPPRSRPASSGRYAPSSNTPATMGPPTLSQENPYAALGSSASLGPNQNQSTAPPVPPLVQSPYAPNAPPATGVPIPSGLQPPGQQDPYTSLSSSAPVGPSVIPRNSHQTFESQPLPKPLPSSRYSPAPPSSSPGRNRYASQPLNVPGQNLPFQPRTSSPLVHHEKVSYQPDQTHKPPTLEPAIDLSPPRIPVSESVYAPQEYLNEFAQRVAPAPSYNSAPPPHNMLVSPPTSDAHNGPIRRSQTQSPARAIANARSAGPAIDTLQRPASVNASGSPTKTVNPYAPVQVPPQNRTVTQHLDFIAPRDGLENDPLERWKGAPVFKFGFGGLVVSCFPRHTPRYSAGHMVPTIQPTVGETKMSQLTQLLPAVDTLAPHPGPLKTKSKKKDLIAWLSSKIAVFENVGVPSFDQMQSDTHKRHDEKTLLWKIVKLLVENDGTLEGSPEIQKSLRQAIFPNLPAPDAAGSYGSSMASNGPSSSVIDSQPDGLGVKWLDELRLHLISGDREKAVWDAVDRRLWGHAMIIASTMDKSISKQVTQEFIRREMRSKGPNSDSLAALYEIFSGNVEESIDELVPPSARAGLQLISKADGQGATKNVLDGLDKWRDTLGLVLSNRSSEDQQALLALGRLLASYGRTEAAHICFIFSRYAVFGGPDDPQANVVLLGADPQHSPSSLLDEDAILLTEAYEYATSILGNSPACNLPHLLSFKLLNARCLVDRGRNAEAQAYCDTVASALKATTRPSPYYHQHVFAEVEEMCARLRQTTPGSGSWISRPSMEKVSGSMWARFNNFVAGDDNDAASIGSGKGEHGEFGPFANVAGTPTISRSPSVSDIYGSYPGPGAGAQPIPTGGASKYHPSNQYASNASPEQFKGRSSMDSQRSNPYFPPAGRRSSQELSPSLDGHMSYGGPIYGSPVASTLTYQPTPPSSSYVPLAPVKEALSPTEAPSVTGQPVMDGLLYQPTGQATESTDSPHYQGSLGMSASEQTSRQPYAPPASNPYAPPASNPYAPPASNAYAPPASNTYDPIGSQSSYDPVGTSSYEPVNASPYMDDSTKPEENESPSDEQPKKKSIMDDDDDDLAARAAAIQKAENDRLANEAFAKAAEEDGMY